MSTLLNRIAYIAENEGISIGKFERQIGASKGVISRAIQNGTDIQAKWIEKIVENYPQYSISWLITGKGGSEHLHISSGNNSNNKLIPLIPTEAFAGYGEYTYDDMPIEEFYAIQEFDNADFLIRIKGDSMSPKYNGGDVIACKIVKEVTFWQWHRVYAIYTRNQGVLIKRVEEYPQNRSFITLVSENPAYKPFELHEDEIVSVALVLGAIVLE